MTTNIEALIQLISTAQTIYGSLAKNFLETDLKKRYGGPDFTEKNI